MGKEITYAGILGNLHRLSGTLDASQEEMPHLEPFLGKLRRIVTEGLEVSRQDHYGIREEEVAELGLQPCRGRKAKRAPGTQRISIVSRQWPVVRGAFPLYAAHFHRLQSAVRRARRISVVSRLRSVVRSAFPLHTAHFHRLPTMVRRARRISAVSLQRSIARSAFALYSAHFHRLPTTVRRTRRISVVSGQRSVVRSAIAL